MVSSEAGASAGLVGRSWLAQRYRLELVRAGRRGEKRR